MTQERPRWQRAIARKRFDSSSVREWYSFDEAEALQSEESSGVIDECFGGALRGGLYRGTVRAAVVAAWADTDAVLSVLRKYPDDVVQYLAEQEVP